MKYLESLIFLWKPLQGEQLGCFEQVLLLIFSQLYATQHLNNLGCTSQEGFARRVT